MSTREIAELTGKEHFHVLRDFRDMCEALELIDSSFGCNYKDSIGRTLPMYALPRDLTTTLVSGYSIPMRHKIVLRWLQLEAKKDSFAIPTTLVEALRLALEGAEKLEAAIFTTQNPRPHLEHFHAAVPPSATLDFPRVTWGGAEVCSVLSRPSQQ